MSFRLKPRLCDLPVSEWQRRYPNGLGASAFGSPGWQRLMQRLVGASSEHRALVIETEHGRYSLPVFVRELRYGRLEIVTHPANHPVLPIECESATAECIAPIADAALTMFTRRFKWWVPPWIAGRCDVIEPGAETYLLELGGDADEYMRTAVNKRLLEYVRSSHRNGIEILERPSEADIERYFALYVKTYEERGWEGDRYSLEFFAEVATTLGDGGGLVLMRHEHQIVGGGIVLFDRHCVHYFQGVTDRANTQVKPHAVLYDWLIRTATARGLGYVNLGGVTEGNDGLIKFKRSWGAKPVAIPCVSWELDRRWLGARIANLTRAAHRPGQSVETGARASGEFAADVRAAASSKRRHTA